MKIEPLACRRLLSVDLLSDAAGLSATNSVTVDGTAYFFADNGAVGRELWKSDGTAAGTALVKDLTPGSAPTELHSIFHTSGGAVFLTVVRGERVQSEDNDHYTLWATDGTPGGTVKLIEFTSSVRLLSKQIGDRVAIMHHQRSQFQESEADYITDAHLYFTDGTV